MKAIESYWKDTAAVWENTKDGLSVLAISDFPSSNHAKLYSTKRKSVKNALDSSLKLISCSSIFASIFFGRSWPGDTNGDESKAFFTLFRLVE